MTIGLRVYQQEFVDDIIAAWDYHKHVLGVLATGGGKTFCFSFIIKQHIGAAAVVVHRKEIVSQISCSLAKLGVKHRVVAPPKTVTMIRRKHLKMFGKSFIDDQSRTGVVSVQTLTSKSSGRDAVLQSWIKQLTLCVFDEGHHYTQAGFWAKAVEMMVNAKILFVTATPERADGTGLGHEHGGFAEIMVESKQTAELIAEGSLARFKYIAPESDLNVQDIAVGKDGELNSKALRARVLESHIVGDAVKAYVRFTPGKRAIVFAPDIATADEMATKFREAGYRAVSLNGSTDQGERDRANDQFAAGELDVLVNVDLFDEGYDVPACEVAILVRPTMSLAKYLQQCGRVLRTADGKEFAYILDLVRNWERHMTPNVRRVWTLAGREKGEAAAKDTMPQRSCDGCSQLYEAFYKVCPYCGTAPTREERSLPVHVDGDLHELDIDALAALFAVRDEANMSREDYALSLIAKRMPEVGQGKAIARHEAAKYRREVLNNIIAWWMGMQPKDRDLREKHKRFFLRFGVDVITAMSRDSKGTDALIEKVSKGFTLDMT